MRKIAQAVVIILLILITRVSVGESPNIEFPSLEKLYSEEPVRLSDEIRTLQPGMILGFRDYYGTNAVRHVYAKYEGGEWIDFSNGIGVQAENKTIGDVIREMGEAIEHWTLPWSAHDFYFELSDFKSEYLHPTSRPVKHLQNRNERLRQIRFRREWYIGIDMIEPP